MKIKLIAILFLAISAVIIVGYVSYIGLSNLMTTLEETVRPDYREEKLHELLYHLSEAENGIRIYTITQEAQYLRAYFTHNDQSDTIIHFLKARSLGDPFLMNYLDTIEQLINNKITIQNRLIRLKQDLKRIDVYEEVLAKIQTLERKNSVFDSLEKTVEDAENKLDKEIFEREQELLMMESEMVDEKTGFFKKLFGPGKKAEKELLSKQETLHSQEKTLDTLLAAKDTLITIIDTFQKETISNEVKQSLEEIKMREEILNRELTIAELILTRRDKDLSSQIQHKVAEIQYYFDRQDIEQTEEASYFFSNITTLIKTIGTISSMAFLVLVFIIFNDIKMNQRYRHQLEISKNKAEKLAQAKNDFLSNMSHEIRTPMNAILGFTEQLSSAELDDKSKKQLGIIQNASQHLLSIINDILDFAKIEAGKVKLEKIPFYVPDDARIVYDILLKDALDKKLNFELEIGDQFKDHLVKGDPVRFRQILFNLAGNAIKFTESGFVKIKIDHDFRHIIIKVMDSGIGIENESIELIFKKFDQANQQTSKKYGGTGLGLAIVKKLVEMQKGTISVNSEKGHGTEFIVKLPYIPIEQSESHPKNSPEESLSKLILPDQVNILLVDDEEYNLLLLESILKKYNVPFLSADSGAKAVELFSKHTFNMALLDLQMDEMNGLETTEVLRNEFNSIIPIIAITASATDEIRKKCFETGMTDVLIKPILEKDLIHILEKYLIKEPATSDEKIGKSKTTRNETQLKNGGFSEIEHLFQHDKQMAFNMTQLYYNSIKAFFHEIKNGPNQQNLARIKSVTHKIIPSTRHMGFDLFAENLKKLEMLIEQGDDTKTIKDLLNKIFEDSKKIIKNLESFLAENKVNTH